MDWEKGALRLGAAVVAGALLLRVLGGGAGLVGQALTNQELTSALVYMHTGRLVKPVAETALSATEQTPTQTLQTENTEPVPTQPQTEPAALPVFGAEDAKIIRINNVCGYKTNIKKMLAQPLKWQLQADEPTVLILHSHATEGYAGISGYRSKSEKKNMLSIGKELKKSLEAAGIGVIHDKTLHDSPSYNDAYANARESIRKYLKKYPSIRMVLDLHRDAVADENGKQMKFSLTVDGTATAQLMLVVGTDAGGAYHPQWEENMALAVKLQAQLERRVPGICRSISFRNQRFNQDLSPGALIVEVGSAGNTQKEALAAARQLAGAVIDLAGGTGS